MANWYVSNEASNGYNVGVDTNPGTSKNRPFLTMAAAHTAASSGDTIWVNGLRYDLSTTGYVVTKNVWTRPEPVRSDGQKFKPELVSSNATAVVQLTAADSPYDLGLGGFTITPVGGIAGATSRAVAINSYSGFDATVIVDGALLSSGTNGHLNDASVRGATRILNCVLQGQIGAQAGIQALNLGTTSDKYILVQGCSSLGTLYQSASNTPAVNISRITPASFDVKVEVLDNNFAVSVPGSLGISATGRVIGVANCKKAYIARNKCTLDSINVTGSDSLGISVTSSSTTAIADETIVEDNEVRMNCPASRAIAIGDGTVSDPGAWAGSTAYTVGTFRRPVAANGLRYEVTSISGTGTSAVGEPTWPTTPGQTVTDNAGANQVVWTCRMYQSVANAIVRRNRMFGTYYNGTATPHGFSSANTYGGSYYSNYAEGFAVGFIISLGGNRTMRGNVAKGNYYCAFFSKGCGITTGTDDIANNLAIADDRMFGQRFGSYGNFGVAAQGSTNTVGVTYANNISKILYGRNWKHVVVDASQVATFYSNCYHSDGGLTLPFSYQGSTYAYTDLWTAARETTAIDLDPAPTTDIASTFVADNPLLVEVGRPIKGGALLLDYNGKRFKNRPSIGAIEYYGQRARVAA